MQHVQEMPARGVVVGLDFDAPPGPGKMVPVAEHRPGRGDKPIGDVARACGGVVRRILPDSSQPSADTPVRSTSIGCAVDGICSSTARSRGERPRSPSMRRLYAASSRRVGQLFVDEQVGDFLELAVLRDVEDVVAAVLQVVAGAADRADRRIAGDDAGQRDGLSSA